MSLSNPHCIKLAADHLGLESRFFDSNHNFIEVKPGQLIFINAHTPFNSGSVASMLKDKDFFFRWLENTVTFPKYKSYLAPNCDDKYKKYLNQKNLNEIVDDMEANFSYPFIVKMNSGLRGKNIFLVKDTADIRRALRNIFDKNKKDSDYIAIAQEYIDIKREYRAITFNGEILLCYEKVFGKKNHISPFQNPDTKAVLVKEEKLKDIKVFLNNSKIKEINYAGLDIVEDQEGKMFLLEANDHPGFNYFVRDNGKEAIVEMFVKILKQYAK